MAAKKPEAQPRKARTQKKEDAATVDAAQLIIVDGVRYVFRADELNAYIKTQFRREFGMSITGYLKSVGLTPEDDGSVSVDEDAVDTDLIAVLVWLARLQTGDRISFEKVAKNIGDQSDISFGDEEEDDDPEA